VLGSSSLEDPVKRHRHLFEQVCSYENLFAAARKAWRGKRSRRPAAEFYSHYEEELVSLRTELLSGTYEHGGYHYFQIHDPKTRTVAAAPFRDRVVHHALVRVLEPIFEKRFIEDSFACRKGKGTHAALRRAHQFTKAWPYVLKCDIARYFPSIDHEILLSQIERVVADHAVLDLIRTILESHCDTTDQEWEAGGDLFSVRERKRGLPIGNLTSQFFANIYLNPLDHFVKHELRVRGYVRYVDDFLLFGSDRAELKRQGNALRDKVTELRLTIHPDKYRLLPTTHGVDFVGFVSFSDGRRKLRKDNVRRFERRLSRMKFEASRGEREWAQVTRSVQSWVAHASHAHIFYLRRDLLGR
jgi:retron-type reverse transcriptase